MLPQIQNVVSARELFNPNPCRDLWESQQYSQAASCSQGSQHSSVELFSQSGNSQQKGNSLFYGWNAQTNSQQMNEDDPKKYYMKYMNKPPLFPDPDRQPHQKNLALNYKEFIEGQKKRAAERDEKDVLDNFITLLKDYTKEVKSALDSFKSNMDITLTATAEQMACAADQSTTLISKLKEDLLENFSDLRHEIKENQVIKEEVAKQNEKIAEQSTELKMLRNQLEEYKRRERQGLEKEASLLEREAQLLEKLREMTMQQQALLNIASCSDTRRLLLGEGSACANMLMEKPGNFLQDSANQLNNVHMLVANEPNRSLPTPNSVSNYSGCNIVGQSNDFSVQHHQYNYLSHAEPLAPPPRLHHPPQLIEPASALHETMQLAPHYSSQRPRDQLEYVNSHSARSTGFVQRVAGRGVLDMPERAIPLQATVAPVQSVQSPLHVANSQEEPERSGITPSTSASIHGVPELTFKSPSGRLDVRFLPRNGRRTKQSPVATVLPQIKVKEEYLEEIKKDVPCPKKKPKDDPLNIFMFDLTSDSPENEPKSLVNRNFEGEKSLVSSQGCRTRSKGRLDPTLSPALSKDREVSSPRPSRADNMVRNAARKVYRKVKSRHGQTHSSHFDGNGTDSDDDLSLCERRPGDRSSVIAHKNKNNTQQLKNFVTNASVTSKAEPSFSRSVPSKRTLAFNQSVFDLTGDNMDIQQMTECIRRHAQQKMFKRTRTT